VIVFDFIEGRVGVTDASQRRHPTPTMKPMPANEPTIADVLTRLDEIKHELRTLALEQRAGFAEVNLKIVEVRQQVHDLGHSLRDLWTEHWAHEHPKEDGAA